MKVLLLDLAHIVAVSEDVDGVQLVTSYGLHDIPEPCLRVIRHALQHTYGRSSTMKVTQQQIEARVKDIRYTYDGTLTICVIELDNGFKALGESACVDPAEYNRSLGETLARSRAMSKLWEAFGFQLAESIYERKGLEYGDTQNGVESRVGYDDEKKGSIGAKLPPEMRAGAEDRTDTYAHEQKLFDAPHGDVAPQA